MNKSLKVLICVLAMSVLLASSLRAQFGVKAGLNFANLKISAEGITLSMTSLAGPVGGVFYSAKISPSFAIQPELLYIQKGAKITVDGETYKDKVTYLEIPVLAKYYVVPEGKKARPVLFAGPAVGIKLSAKESFDGESVDIEGIKGTDFGAVFGGGVEISMGKALFIIDARYNLGLANIATPDFVEGEDVSIKNKGFAIMIGVGF